VVARWPRARQLSGECNLSVFSVFGFTECIVAQFFNYLIFM